MEALLSHNPEAIGLVVATAGAFFLCLITSSQLAMHCLIHGIHITNRLGSWPSEHTAASYQAYLLEEARLAQVHAERVSILFWVLLSFTLLAVTAWPLGYII